MNKLNVVKSRAFIFCVCAISVLLTSCATKEIEVDTEEAIDVKNGLVVRDFLVAISQVYDPSATTIQLNKPVSRFGVELENGFRELGFGMQRVASDQGALFLSYTKTLSENSGKVASETYRVQIDDVGFERTYAAVAAGGIAPTGAMIIYGTEKPIQLSGYLFPGLSVDVVYAEDSDIKLDAGAITVIDESVMTAISELRNSDLPSYKSLNSQNQEIENLFNRGTSNFETVDKSYRTVREDTIIFADDSLVLDSKGRLIIGKLMKFYNPQTDVFRLVGCSIGPTKADGGNEKLALGRSQRVAQELVSRQVELDAIFDEGCWSPTVDEAEKEYPARAVIVELQRRG